MPKSQQIKCQAKSKDKINIIYPGQQVLSNATEFTDLNVKWVHMVMLNFITQNSCILKT